MARSLAGLNVTSLPAGEDFLDRIAAAMFEQIAGAVDAGDLSSVCVLVPALPIAAELRAAMLRAVPRSVLLPRFDTLKNWVQSTAAGAVPAAMADSERLVLLHEALRERGWFDESALWGIAAEMAGLFDELTAAAVALPHSEEALALQLQAAYGLRASAPLAFEARVVHELWGALTSTGYVDAASACRLRMGALLRQLEQGAGRKPQLLVLLDSAPDESLDAAECDFLRRYGESKPVSIYYPLPREADRSALMAVLACAWPESADIPLFERAFALAKEQPESPLAGRLQFVPASGREQEAQAVTSQVGAWLAEGLRRIVLITQDRLTTRRVRALLEREGVLVSDETGWKLSTSRAAAAVDALIETAASHAYYRDLFDLCKSPFVFSDCDESERKAAVYALEAAVRAASVKVGLPRIRRCVQEQEQASGDRAGKEAALGLVDRVDAATNLLRARPASLAHWIGRLLKALEVIGAIDSLRADVAGKMALDLLEERRIELNENNAVFSFSAWREWLNRAFESANFRDAGIASPIVLTPLNAVCLRRFEAAIVIGGDAQQLAPVVVGEFFNTSVRRELGLRTRDDAARELRRDLELLLATVPRVTVTWQSEKDGEANLLSPDLALLSTLHRIAWRDDLLRAPLPARAEAVPDVATLPQTPVMADPVALPALIPRRLSVSGYATLVNCPYRFFARHVLGLGEIDEIKEALVKSDYGTLVHRVLERFHERHPCISDLEEGVALLALQNCVTEVFAAAVEDDFLATGWRQRWEKRLPAYLDWQRSMEALGWRWTWAETRVARVFLLDGEDGGRGSVELYGRIDRIDTKPGEGNESRCSLFDYKTQTAEVIRSRLKDDVQLPAYALLHGNAAQAAYVALDDERVLALGSGGEEGLLMEAAEAQGQRLQKAFRAMHAGAKLPAHGVDSVCAWCEMKGLCRKDFV